MYDHWHDVEEYTGRKITVVKPKKPFLHWMLRQEVVARKGPHKGEVHRIGNGWPSPLRRWCTRQKVDALDKGAKDASHYVGIAADEVHRTNSVSSNKRSGERLYPLVDWGVTEADALAYCLERGFTWGGLYDHFKRVSCFCCPLQGLDELRVLRREFPGLWAQMLEWDRAIPENTGFHHYDTVEDLEQRFAREEEIEKCQMETDDRVTCPFWRAGDEPGRVESIHDCDPERAEKHVRKILNEKGLVW